MKAERLSINCYACGFSKSTDICDQRIQNKATPIRIGEVFFSIAPNRPLHKDIVLGSTEFVPSSDGDTDYKKKLMRVVSRACTIATPLSMVRKSK